jgi:hypothetical protein
MNKRSMIEEGLPQKAQKRRWARRDMKNQIQGTKSPCFGLRHEKKVPYRANMKAALPIQRKRG